jgi:hypothetical protein
MSDAERFAYIEKMAVEDAGYAVAYGLLKVADAQTNVATQLKFLGTGDAATALGGIEGLALLLGQKLDLLTHTIAVALSDRRH